MADWAELRVHGVSGTPPDHMLSSAHTVQVAGDDRSRCFRPTDAQGREERAPDGHLLEAFHWGRWTSGSWMQGVWLLLIPFGIVKSAQYMLPAPTAGPARGARALAGALLRIVALVLTGLFAVTVCLVVVDLVAWQRLLGPSSGGSAGTSASRTRSRTPDRRRRASTGERRSTRPRCARWWWPPTARADPVAGPVTSRDHTPDGEPPASRRLAGPDRLLPDSIAPAIGRRVRGAEWRLLDPVPGDLELQTRAVTGLGGHSGYWLEPDWDRALAAVRGVADPTAGGEEPGRAEPSGP